MQEPEPCNEGRGLAKANDLLRLLRMISSKSEELYQLGVASKLREEAMLRSEPPMLKTAASQSS
jgi:hypothetical protein